MIIVPEGERGRVAGFLRIARREKRLGLEIAPCAAEQGAALIEGRTGAGARYGGLHAAQRRDGRDVCIVVEAERLIVSRAPASRAHVPGPGRPEEDLIVAIAPEIGVGHKIGIEEVLIPHQAAQLPDALSAHGFGRERAARKSAAQFRVHGTGAGQIPVIAGQALDMLQFHGLGVDGRIAGVLDVRMPDHGFFQGRDPMLGRGAAVGVRLGALAVAVIQGNHGFQRRNRNIVRAHGSR